jgi:hypothetical protein
MFGVDFYHFGVLVFCGVGVIIHVCGCLWTPIPIEINDHNMKICDFDMFSF